MRRNDVVVDYRDDGLEHAVTAGGHQFLVDEPAEVGGKNRGPTPYDLILGALGSCTSMTLLLYARRKHWPLEHVRVRLHHDRVHQSDCLGCEDGRHFLDRIEREVELTGPLTDEQRQRLLQIADLCPVHKTLEAGVKIVTTLKPAEPPTPPRAG